MGGLSAAAGWYKRVFWRSFESPQIEILNMSWWSEILAFRLKNTHLRKNFHSWSWIWREIPKVSSQPFGNNVKMTVIRRLIIVSLSHFPPYCEFPCIVYCWDFQYQTLESLTIVLLNPLTIFGYFIPCLRAYVWILKVLNFFQIVLFKWTLSSMHDH